MTQALDLSGAKSYSARLIKFRPRSEKEVRDKLKIRKYDPAVIDQAVSALIKSRMIDDVLFAKLWVQSRIKRPLGLERLRRELRSKGVADEIIEEALAIAAQGYDEAAVIGDIIERKTAQAKGLPEDKVKARIFGYLIRRGFSRERVMEAVLGIWD